MAKYSVIVPVYNAEMYLRDCLDSILKQSYKDFELLLVNDGSTDNSQDIIDEYVKKDSRVKSFKKKNEGIGTTRNFGISKAKGEFFIFIDSDDTVNSDLLREVDKELSNYPDLDLVKYQIQVIDKETTCDKTELFSNVDGEEAFKRLINNELFVTPVTYAYRRDYFNDNKFTYIPGRVHEDYGLTPFVVVNASKVSAIDYVGYNYLIRENSIMTDNSSPKARKKAEDSLYQFDRLIEMINKDDKISEDTKKVFRSYVANGLITKCAALGGDLFESMLKEVKKRDLAQYLLNDTLGRKMKKIVYKIMPKVYMKKFK